MGPEDLVEIKNIFTRLDKYHNGSLSMMDIENGLYELKLDKNYADKMMENVRKGYPKDCNEINYTQFISLTMPEKYYMNEKHQKSAFEMFDKDGSGAIDYDELVVILNGGQFPNSGVKQMITEIIKKIDRKGKGCIDFDDFKAMMVKCPDCV